MREQTVIVDFRAKGLCNTSIGHRPVYRRQKVFPAPTARFIQAKRFINPADGNARDSHHSSSRPPRDFNNFDGTRAG
jgi:hypothetical protein